MEERVYKIKAKKEQLDILDALLRTMEEMGAAGSSRAIKLYVDGDGAFRPRVQKYNTETKEFEDLDNTLLAGRNSRKEPVIEYDYGVIQNRFNIGAENEYYGEGYYVYYDFG